MLNDALKNVSVIGAAGKMGSGISLLILQEIACIDASIDGTVGRESFRLNLIDTNEDSLTGLIRYLRTQLVKFSEKNIVSLRGYYKSRKDLIENGEIIEDFVNNAMSYVRVDTDLTKVKSSSLVFEAIIEDVDIKIDVYKKMKSLCSDKTFFFTNTSSVPISIIDERAELDGRIIGCHFYNPPAVQKLVEVIPAKNTKKELNDLTYDLGRRLKKTLVPACDKAGFIGNGHFLRDVLYSIGKVTELQKENKFEEAVYTINKVSQDFMIRPMGIFQLIDYVGIDVCGFILKIMKTHLKDIKFESKLINNMMDLGVKGGQRSDGSQKDGFLKYEKNRPVGVYSIDKKDYVRVEDGLASKCDDKLGKLPDTYRPWKALLVDPLKDEKLAKYFKDLFNDSTLGATLAKEHLIESRSIANTLVKDEVAHSIEDVNKILQNGFFHLYGPENKFF